LETIIFTLKVATDGTKGTEELNLVWKEESLKNDGYRRRRHQKFGSLDHVYLY
jgi:hypothetical protein